MKTPPREAFDRQVYATWAAHFHVPLETVHTPGTTLLPEEKFAGKDLLALWHVGDHVFVEADPGYAQPIAALLAGLPTSNRLSLADLQRAWGKHAIRDYEPELVFYIFPADLPAFTPPDMFPLRRLTSTDAGAMHALHQACTPEEVDEGYVEVDHQIAFGCSLVEPGGVNSDPHPAPQLVAAASGYERTGFMDIGVLVHPAYRRRGLARAVVGALSEWAASEGYIAQYRCNARNTASRRVAESLNFRLYSQSEAVWLNAEAD